MCGAGDRGLWGVTGCRRFTQGWLRGNVSQGVFIFRGQ